jgi:hypothetical protein
MAKYIPLVNLESPSTQFFEKKSKQENSDSSSSEDEEGVIPSENTSRCARCGLYYQGNGFSDNVGELACHYHPGTFRAKFRGMYSSVTLTSWSCCDNTSERAKGCKAYARHLECARTAQALRMLPRRESKGKLEGETGETGERGTPGQPEATPTTEAIAQGIPELVPHDPLVVPVPSSKVERSGENYIKHFVSNQDTLLSISVRYDVEVDELCTINRLPRGMTSSSLYTRLFVLVPDRGQQAQHEDPATLAQRLIQRFVRTARCSAGEARSYLAMAAWQYEAALEQHRVDVGWEHHHPIDAAKVQSHPDSNTKSKGNQKSESERKDRARA